MVEVGRNKGERMNVKSFSERLGTKEILSKTDRSRNRHLTIRKSLKYSTTELGTKMQLVEIKVLGQVENTITQISFLPESQATDTV